jgi:hypothetical protein
LLEELGILVTVGEILDATFHRYEEADKAVLLLFFEATRTPASPPPQALDVAALLWADAADLVPEKFPPADVTILRKVEGRMRSCPQ